MKVITTEVLAKLEAWKQAGDRCIKFDKDRHDEDWNIWIYDYSVPGGDFIKDVDMDKDWSTLILASKRQYLAQELECIDKKLGGVA